MAAVKEVNVDGALLVARPTTIRATASVVETKLSGVEIQVPPVAQLGTMEPSTFAVGHKRA